jgi:hypothetical protein
LLQLGNPKHANSLELVFSQSIYNSYGALGTDLLGALFS